MTYSGDTSLFVPSAFDANKPCESGRGLRGRYEDRPSAIGRVRHGRFLGLPCAKGCGHYGRFRDDSNDIGRGLHGRYREVASAESHGYEEKGRQYIDVYCRPARSNERSVGATL